MQRALRYLGVAGAMLAVLVGLAWTGVPRLVQWQLQARGSEWLGRELRVGAVEFTPWRLALTLHEITLGAAADDRDRSPQLAIRRLLVDADLRSLLRLAPVLEALEIDAPRLRLAQVAPGRFDIDDLLQRFRPQAPPDASARPARFALHDLQLRDGELAFDDRPLQRRHQVGSIQLALPFLSSLPDDAEVDVQPRLAFMLGKAAIELQGRSRPFTTDRATELAMQTTEIDLAPWWAYLPRDLPLTPRGGSLQARLTLRLSQPPGQAPRLAVSGDATLRQLALHGTGDTPLLSWRSLALSASDLRPLERQLALDSLRLDGAVARVQRDASGRIDWQALVAARDGAPDAAASGAAATAAPLPWRLSVQRTDIADARVHWRDAAVQPAADWTLDALQAQAGALRWPGNEAAPLQLAATLTAAGKPIARLRAQGQASAQAASATLEVDDAQLTAAAPYLKTVLKPALEGRAQLRASVEWAAGETPKLAAAIPLLKLDNLRVLEAGGSQGRAALEVGALTLEQARIDLLARRADAALLRLQRARLALHRDANGILNLQRWLAAPAGAARRVAAQAPPPTEAAAAPTPWRGELRELQVEAARIRLDDDAVRPGTRHSLQLDATRLAVQALAWPASASPVRLQLAARLPAGAGEADVPGAGRLEARGVATLAPLTLRGRWLLERVPLHAFEPYFAAALPVHLERAEVGWVGDIALRHSPQGLALQAEGDALVADLSVRVRAGEAEAGDELLNWQSLTLKPLRLVLAPGSKPDLRIGELVLSDFYSRLVVTEDGHLRLRDQRHDAGAEVVPAATAAAVPPATPAGAAREAPLELVVESSRLQGGRVDFTDRYIRPNYSAALSELQGSIGRIASGASEMAAVDLRGRVAGTGLLEIRGALNPMTTPLALDITARATDLELAPLSPYSGKYAGYAIERGKLSVDVSYRIADDGRLEARNQIILNQLTFGEKVDSPVATKLPVRLAVALLANRNGVIDIELPISGSINDPQFSIWGIVWRLIGNLLLKALTAPFSLLAGAATSGGPELGIVEFVPGTSKLAAPGTAALERVAQALLDRPALRITVHGSADAAAEGDAMQTAALDARLQTERRREAARGGVVQAISGPPPPLVPEERTGLLRRLYAETPLPDKPRNLLGLLRELPPAEMEARLRAAMPAGSDEARDLAIRRGLAVRDALIERGLPSERLFLGAARGREAGSADWTPRVELSLSTP